MEYRDPRDSNMWEEPVTIPVIVTAPPTSQLQTAEDLQAWRDAVFAEGEARVRKAFWVIGILAAALILGGMAVVDSLGHHYLRMLGR